ncbi:MAG: tetratricopeptide repeat protein [Spirochaetales bacterium]|jgi:Flp pilus assembly protein TadD|nr:tetratricopeptide repeat protein [Spirochaetales bacterium]
MKEKTPSSVSRQITKANDLIDAGKLNEAEECLKTLCAENLDCGAALFNLGIVLERQGRDDEALKVFTRVMKLEGDASDALNEIGLIHYRSRYFTGAEAAFRDALFLGENDSRVLNNLGVLLFVQNRYSEAEPFFARAVEIDPDNKDYAANLSDLRAELRKK